MSSITLSLSVRARMLVELASGFAELSVLCSDKPDLGRVRIGILSIVLTTRLNFGVNRSYSSWLGQTGDVQLGFLLFSMHE
jgi:hypothetical protein